MKRAITVLSLAALALAGCEDHAAAPAPKAASAAAPDIARCDAQHVQHPDAPNPADPLAIPMAFRGIAKASALEMALLTQSGATVCHNTAGLYRVQDMAWLREDRLLGWKWEAHEAFGFTIFDRAGKGTVIDTGVRPVFSPSGARFASVDFSEMGFGALGGFAVWEVRPETLAQLGGEVTRVTGQGDDMVIIDPEIFRERFGEWTIAGWRGESCVDLSFEGQEPSAKAGAADTATVSRTFHAAQSAGWQIAPGRCPA